MSSETEDIPQFRPIDLPFVHVNTEFYSSDYSDIEDSAGYSTPNTPVTPSILGTPSSPSTPGTPLTQFATSVTAFGFTEARA